MNNPWRTIFGLLCAYFLAPIVLLGQTGTSSIRGTVTDPSGAIIVDASVKVFSPATNLERMQRTGPTGNFSFELLPVGDYRVEVEAPGFKKEVLGVHALVGRPAELSVRLELGSPTQTVEVTAENSAVQVNTQDSSLGNNFVSQQITQLPLEARNVLSLLTLQPGVTRSGYVAGARSDQSNITLDGININDAQTNAIGNAEQSSPINGPVLRLNSEAIEEFRVSTVTANASAGRSSGAQIALVTKRGSNDFHGSLFESHRNTIFTANDWFNNNSGVPRPVLLRNTFGGALGGRVIKDKLFFFYSYEGKRDASSIPVPASTVPLPTLGQGIVRFKASNGTVGSLTPAELQTIFPDTGGENPTAVAAIAKAAATYPANDFTVGDSKPGQLFNVAGIRFNSSAPAKWNSHVADCVCGELPSIDPEAAPERPNNLLRSSSLRQPGHCPQLLLSPASPR